MYGRALGSVVATLLLGASGSHAVAEEEPSRASNPQRDAGDDAWLQSPDPGDVYGGDLTYSVPRTPIAMAYAAPLVASADTCMGSRTFGVQVASFGVSFATTWQDRNCRRLRNARELYALGYRDAAAQLLCLDGEVRAAMERAGTPCETIRYIAPPQIAPPAPEPPDEPPLITFDDVLFDFDRATLRSEANRILEPLLAMLRADPTMNIDIEGHTDFIGTDAYNQRLSERRARAVVEWLAARGIARDRISAVGRGEGEPVSNNTTAEGRQLNRRVEIRRR